MAISRQSDTIWAVGAMGYGESHSPARDDDKYHVGKSARELGEAMGRKHAHESIDHYHRDEQGRFAPMPHHKDEHEHTVAKLGREHRDGFAEGYHKGFHSKIKEHEAHEKEKANRTSSVLVRQAVSFDPATGQAALEDPGRFHYRLNHGGSDEGYEPPSWLESVLGDSEKGGYKPWTARMPTDANPYRTHTDTIKNLANDPRFGLSLGMDEKAPFSPSDVGLDAGSKKDNRARAALRPGELASRPIQVTDHMGNVHTFVHHVTAPNLNLRDPSDPSLGGAWVVSLHHHVARPDGSAEWLPSEVTHHVDAGQGVRGKVSDDLQRDIWGQLHANSDMVSMYGAGAQRVGDKHTSIEYEFPHPQGDVVYRAKLANGWNKYDGYYYDPSLPSRHKESIGPRPQWIVTGRGLERQFPHDPASPTHMVTIEGSDAPSDRTISFDHEDIPGVIDHVWSGLGKGSDRPTWTKFPQHSLPNTGGKPAEKMVRGSAIRPWEPGFNIHRSAERLPLW